MLCFLEQKKAAGIICLRVWGESWGGGACLAAQHWRYTSHVPSLVWSLFCKGPVSHCSQPAWASHPCPWLLAKGPGQKCSQLVISGGWDIFLNIVPLPTLPRGHPREERVLGASKGSIPDPLGVMDPLNPHRGRLVGLFLYPEVSSSSPCPSPGLFSLLEGAQSGCHSSPGSPDVVKKNP
jgi:hypothetical protein